MSEADQPVPGFYGKLPAVGDFVSRRLPRSFLDGWDQWLQGAIAASRARLGEGWLDLYLTSPIWRFALAPGVCGPTGWAGVLMPSVDRVGRYFPMTIALSLPAGAGPAHLPAATDWYERAEAAALSVLEQDGVGVDQFDGTVTALGTIAVPVPDDASIAPAAPGQQGWRLPVTGGDAFAALIPAVADVLLEQRFGPYSLWWSEGSERIDPGLLLGAGLPDGEAYADMLGAGWQSGAWEAWPSYRVLATGTGTDGAQ
ncbi:MAG: type VI secretion system-associated protein TagF [Gammaproteobacteria bacterium]